MRTLTSLTLAALFAGGCVVVHDNPPPPHQQPPPTTPPPATTIPTYGIDPGASTIVLPGQQAGYGITANVGGSYRVVWTGDTPTAYTNFTGYIYTPGHFTVVNPGCGGQCPIEANDYIYAPVAVQGGGEEIDFDTVATDGLDGLDFGTDAEPVTLDLLIDGVRYPQLVFFTSGGVTSAPSTIPFALTTQ